MSRDPTWDAVIAGGGASGLSLAGHLARSGWGGHRVLLVDDGSHDVGTRAWAYWGKSTGLLDRAVVRSYAQVHVHAHGSSRRLSLAPYDYRVVEGSALRRTVEDLCRTCPGFRLAEGRVEAIHVASDRAVVVVDGREIEGAWVFDSVLTRPPAARVHLGFSGWDVETERAAFDPRVPTLMDFRTEQDDELRFVYVLPVTDRRALVEHVRFGGRVTAEDAGSVARYLADVLDAGPYTVRRAESGVLPLQPFGGRARSGRVVAIGNRGGLLKASTGYAFGRIQRDSAGIAASLDRHGHPHARPRGSARHRFLDATLLQLVTVSPAAVEEAFDRLLTGRRAAGLLRFLDEDTSVREEVGLLRTLPVRPFVRSASHLVWGRRT